MPELPEVETVKETLKKELLHKKILKTKVYYPKMIEYPDITQFEKEMTNQKIIDIKRRGKWLMFELEENYLLSHLRMEGKYFFHNPKEPIGKHEHISFLLDDGRELRYHDTRKFGRMYFIKKEEATNQKPLSELGFEPWDSNLTPSYLKEHFQKKTLPIKTVLLDQSIIVGIGNIYDDEILFRSHISPLKPAKELTTQELEHIIQNTKEVLEQAILKGGTTIRSFESSKGVHGRFQQELLVHGKEICPNCKKKITKIKIGGRGTYYCTDCQK